MDSRSVAELFSNIFDGQYPDKHRVLLVWRSPLNNEYEHRSGAFEDYTEAKMYADMLKEIYVRYGFPFELYLDRSVYCIGGEI